MNIILDENIRKEIWNELTSCEYKTRDLKGIVQNEMPIRNEDISVWKDIKNSLITNLNNIENLLINSQPERDG